MAHHCFKQDCELEVQYFCQCLSSVTYCCEFHLKAHLKLPNRTHSFDSILTESSEFTKDIVLKFLENEKAKKEKLKKIAEASFNKNQNNTENHIKSSLDDLNSDLKEIKCLIEKISQNFEKDSLNLLVSQQDADKKEAILKNDLDEYDEVGLFCKISQLRNKTSKILNRANNDPETEQEFRSICSLYENYASDPIFNQAYQEFIKGYQQITSTYLMNDNRLLYIYSTEIEKEEIKYLHNPKRIDFFSPFLTQLPNGDKFVVNFHIPFIIDKNYQTRKLPLRESDFWRGVIYFDKSIYCFGGRNNKKFDLDGNRWTNLVLMKKHINDYCTSVVFNRNILISIDKKQNILLYSIDTDSFSELPYSFEKSKKILINAEGKLYLIECIGFIYESENEYDWKQIGKSIIEINPKRAYCCYNKGGIYISLLNADKCRSYFKFDLNRKALIEIAFYSEDFSLQRSGEKFKTIKYHDNTFEINNHPANYIDNGDTLRHIGTELKKLNEKIKHYEIAPDTSYWNFKGNTLCSLGIYLDAIEFYNKSIEIDPNCAYTYNNKGNALQKLGRHLEAIECYNEAIKLSPNYLEPYNNKGNILQKLRNHLEAIECYNELIKLAPENDNGYLNKGNALMNLGRNIEAIECYNDAIKINPDNARAYNSKGEAFYNLERNIEAIEFYNEAIKLKIDEPVFYRNRGNAFKKVGREIEALEDFNKADDLMKNLQMKE